MNINATLAAMTLLGVLTAVPASALNFGTNITIPDKHTTSKSWEGNYEDQETEPGTVHTQQWDLEGMFLKGTELTLVGGYDFKRGYGGTTAGDIFIDVTGNAQYGSTNSSLSRNSDTKNLSGYDLVLDLDFRSMTFDVIQLINGTSVVHTGTDIAQSNPWRWVKGGTTLFQDIGFSYLQGLTDLQTGFKGGTHYAITLDVSFLSGQDAIFHNTMSCGNDNLMGRAHVPDAGATASLLGFSLLGLVAMRRRFSKA